LEILKLIGWDPAWGERNPDGLVVARVENRALRVTSVECLEGEKTLRRRLTEELSPDTPAWIAMDGPVVCPNDTGSRPVDRLAQTLFRAFHAGPHPANRTLCRRIVRVVENLRDVGVVPGWSSCVGSDPAWRAWLAEVFPHPALVRWGHLTRTFKYKRGPVAQRREEFARLQRFVRTLLAARFPEVDPGPVAPLLDEPWSKPVEDQLDAFLSLLVGWQHLRSDGRETELLGDLESGFLLVPKREHP
jgi:predicted RNase H-like nuclease